MSTSLEIGLQMPQHGRRWKVLSSELVTRAECLSKCSQMTCQIACAEEDLLIAFSWLRCFDKSVRMKGNVQCLQPG